MTDEEKQEQVVAKIAIDNLARSVERLTTMLSDVSSRLLAVEQRLDKTDERVEEVEASVEELEDETGADGMDGTSGDADGDWPGEEETTHHAYEVSTTNDGKVLCFLPKDQFGEFFPYAQGGKHMGSTPGVTADQDAAPYPAGGPASGSERPTWAHYGWYELGSTLDTESEEVNDKLVIATFTIPRDPKKIGYPPPQVEGPKLVSVSLMDADDWPNYAQQTWQEFDDPSSNSVVRQVVIALVANGLVTQLTMTPYLWAPPRDYDGSDSDSDSDSDGDCVPEYEIAKTSSSGACTDEYKLKRTDCQGGVTYPGDTIEVPKPKSYTISAGGSSGCVDRSYKLMETDCSGEHSAGVAIEIPNPPEYALAVSGGSCSKTVSLTKTPCGGSASQAGDSFSFDVPPTISASATGNSSGGAKAGTVTITPCSGTPTVIDIYNGQDGCTPEVSATSTGSSGAGALAGTVYVTPCGGTQTSIPIYNGPRGPAGSDAELCTSTPIYGFGGIHFTNAGVMEYNKVPYTFSKTASGCWALVPGADNWQPAGLQVQDCS